MRRGIVCWGALSRCARTGAVAHLVLLRDSLLDLYPLPLLWVCSTGDRQQQTVAAYSKQTDPPRMLSADPALRKRRAHPRRRQGSGSCAAADAPHRGAAQIRAPVKSSPHPAVQHPNTAFILTSNPAAAGAQGRGQPRAACA